MRAPVGGDLSASNANAGGSSGGATLAVGNLRLREVPLAVVMVGLTTLTLWSLGQAIVQPA
jgi:hypothetical protein